MVLTIVFGIVLSGQFRTTVNAASSNSQTKYSNVKDFQENRWLSIENSVFGKNWKVLHTAQQIGNAITKNNITVSDSNPYFNWTDTGLDGNKKWDGTTGNKYRTDNKKEVTIDYNVNDGTNENLKITFTEFTINNAKQFRDVLEYFNDSEVTNKYVKVNLNSDLDMGGQDGVIWDPIETNYCLDNNYKKWLYIEGNGHTIYNLCIYTNDKDKGAGLFSHPPAFMIVKNLGFQSSMVLHGYDDGDSYSTSVGLIAGFCPQKGYFYNVHSDGGYFQMSDQVNTVGVGGMGGLIGRKDIWGSRNTFSGRGAFERINTGDFYLENCSTSNYYMYGSDHIGGLTSFMGVNAKTLSRYDRKFPQKPERFIVRDRNYGKYTQDQYSECLEHIEQYNYFPIMVKDCYSVDSTIFSTGHDSGAFISCGRGIVAEGCFTNNTIYATDNTGGFIGRVVNTNLPYIMDARGENGDNTVAKNYTIGSYFKDCYSSGIVEGSNAMGGFVGLDNTRRNLNSIYTDTGANPRTSTQNYSSTLYENCYSTAMVGMDYAGKYCGGFIGLDDNYGETGLTVAINQNGKTVQQKVDVGSAYINCYAAGEVGNILTITDIDSKTKTRENNYFKNHECKNESTVLDYYPTGGFAGAVGLDLYYYTNKKELTGETPTDDEKTFRKVKQAGYFYNCYYDMQTTAMHEMAIGLAKQQTCRGAAGENFNVVGITGLYTVDSDVKLVPGLTGSPKSYASGKSFKMDDNESNSTIWQYNDGYYPQLKLFMASDVTLSDITTANNTNITNAMKKSEFFIDVDADESTRSEPVLSLANSLAGYDNKNNKVAAQIAGVITAYRYSQASTSTVFLDHWDYTMDTNSGATEGENDWRPGLEQNRMVKETVTDENGNEIEEWQITYTNVEAGTYEFKVQAGTSWAYNYGRTRFNDTENISLVVPFDKCTVKIRFHYEEIKNNKFYVKADFYDETGEFVRTETLTSPVYQEYEPTPYTVAGSLPEQSWNADKNDLYTMTYMGDERTYLLTIRDLPEGFYRFKITNGGGWGVNYGIDGVSDGNNMEFTLTGTTDVTIVFDEQTKLCEVSAEIPECLTNVHVSDKKIDFTGYSVICSSSQITGYTWLTDGQEKEAAEAGQLFYDSSEGVYTRIFNLPIKNDSGQYINVEENYAYKVIKDAVDDRGPNSGFYISKPLDDSITEIPLVFKYNKKTDEASVSSTIEDVVQPNVRATNYSVVGTEGLTGYNWLGDAKGD